MAVLGHALGEDGGLTALTRWGAISIAAARTKDSTAPFAIAAALPVTMGSRFRTPAIRVNEPRSARCRVPCRTTSIWAATLPR
jgi:hypothetical protein